MNFGLRLDIRVHLLIIRKQSKTVITLFIRSYLILGNSGERIRLAGLNKEHEGRVEILHNNTWGIVNDYWFGYPGANVFCKMMGYQ